MDEETLKQINRQLDKKIVEWLKEIGITFEDEKLIISVKVVPSPRVEASFTPNIYRTGSVDDRCATRIADLELDGRFKRYISGFITLGQLTRYKEGELENYNCPGAHNSIGDVTIRRIKDLLALYNLGFNSQLPMGKKELCVILDTDPFYMFRGQADCSIICQIFPTVRSITASTEKNAREKIGEIISTDRLYRGIKTDDVIKNIVSVLSQFSLSFSSQ